MGPFWSQMKSLDSSLYLWLILLVFFPKETQPLKILLTPRRSSHSVKVGEHVTLICTTGPSVKATYKWQNDLAIGTGKEPSMITGNATLKIWKTKLHHTGVYSCTETRKGEEILQQTRSVLLTIVDMCHEATITIQPTLARIYSEGTDLTLYCECPSNSNEKTITWIKNGAKVTPHNRQSITSDGKKLMLKNVKFADSGKYACNVTVDRMVTATSKELELWVGNKPEITDYPPEVTQFKLWTQYIFLTCIAEGVPYPRVKWYYNGGPDESQIPVPNDGTNFTVFDNGTMAIREFRSFHVAVYKCVAINILGSTKRIIHIQTPIKIEVQRKVSAAEGKSFNWRCTVEGLPKPNVYWADAKRNEIREGTRFITRFAEELRIQNVRMGDSGRYYCVAYRNETRESKWTELRMDVYENDSLAIKSSPKNITHVFTGTTVTLRCEFDSKAPFTTWWGIKGLEGLPDYYRMRDYGSWLEIDDVGESDNNVYYCRASNGFKTVTAYTHLSVYKSTEWKPSNITVYVGDSVWFHCDARRVPRFPFKVAWFKRGQGSQMLDKKRFRVIANGSIHITDIRLNDEGKYFCITNKNFKQTFGTRYLLVREKLNGTKETPHQLTAACKKYRSHFPVVIFVVVVIYAVLL